MKKAKNFLFSYWTTVILLSLLAIGAAVATFIENDFGTETAQVLVYKHMWYEVILIATTINMVGIMYKTRMWKKFGRFVFHLSFVVILIGAGVTRYVGFEGIMQIREGQKVDQMISLEPYLQVTIQQENKKFYQEYQKNMSAVASSIVNSFNHTIGFNGEKLNVKYADYTFAKKGKSEMGILHADITYKGETQRVKLVGKRGMRGVPKSIAFDNGAVKVNLQYGSKIMKLPFKIGLRDFQLDRYPGSMSPSSYASEVTVFPEDDEPFDYRIFMNNTLHFGNYLFFQSSYDQDEKGTVLSVNHDPGKWPTYLGYFLLTLGLLVNLFDRKSRFMKLSKYVKQFNSLAVIAIAACFLNTSAYSETFEEYTNKYKTESLKTAEIFGKLVVQSSGRMKPNNSLNMEIVQKLTGKKELVGLNADQVVMGMMSRPEVWQAVKMIKIKTPKLKKVLGLDESTKYVAFSEVFEENKYKLAPYIEAVSKINPAKRGTFEKDVIRVDERINIAYMVFYGSLFKAFPEQNSATDRWFNPLEAIQKSDKAAADALKGMVGGFVGFVAQGNWEKADEYLALIARYQNTLGKDVMPSQSILENEITFNNIDLFPKLTLAYILVGMIMLVISFATVLNKNLQSKKLELFFFGVLALLFLMQTYAMGLRWYVSGHAPWSNTYESLLYIAWSGLFAGVVFFRKNLLALAASVIVAAIFMFTAHLSHIDPQITTLVPVLKSYWLTVHVSIITGSYGFLGLGAVLGFMSLILFIIRDPKKPNIDDSIRQMTAINEMALIIGLSFLVVGNFLGGVWANESWGRYWGWDPKETWAYVAIVAYIIVLHLRFIPKLDNPFVFSTASLLAFATILMTYFGVNFYLSGMHSYATGDPVPVPTWVYILTALVFIVIAIASKKRDLPRLKIV